MTRTDWTTAKCRDHDPDMWFSSDVVDVMAAKAVCRTCPIQTECQERAIEENEEVGVWGAMDEDERQRLLRRNRRRSAPSALCIEPGCERFARTLRMCQSHYKHSMERRPVAIAS